MTTPTDTVTLYYTTWPDAGSAERAAEALLDARLIACANILGEMRSVYRWDGAVQRETEVAVLFKTSAGAADAARAHLIALHPYDEPCVLALPVDVAASASGFIGWVLGETGKPAVE